MVHALYMRYSTCNIHTYAYIHTYIHTYKNAHIQVLIELHGITTMHEIMETNSVPVRVSLCKTILSLVSSRDMADKLIRDG